VLKFKHARVVGAHGWGCDQYPLSFGRIDLPFVDLQGYEIIFVWVNVCSVVAIV
jgi:hypothetical protein